MVLIFPGTLALVKMSFNTKLQAFHTFGGIICLWEKRVVELLSVLMITGLIFTQIKWLKTLKVKQMAENSSGNFELGRCVSLGAICHGVLGFTC